MGLCYCCMVMFIALLWLMSDVNTSAHEEGVQADRGGHMAWHVHLIDFNKQCYIFFQSSTALLTSRSEDN